MNEIIGKIEELGNELEEDTIKFAQKLIQIQV